MLLTILLSTRSVAKYILGDGALTVSVVVLYSFLSSVSSLFCMRSTSLSHFLFTCLFNPSYVYPLLLLLVVVVFISSRLMCHGDQNRRCKHCYSIFLPPSNPPTFPMTGSSTDKVTQLSLLPVVFVYYRPNIQQRQLVHFPGHRSRRDHVLQRSYSDAT